MCKNSTNNIPTSTKNTFFATVYNWLSRSSSERSFMEPLRKELVGKARGVVLEVGAGNGLNFAFYQPGQVERVEAVDLDTAMLGYARKSLRTAKVPITITQAPAEALPFPDALFDSAVVTLVFCSVTDPLRGLAEIKRVLKPGGILLMVEHVRSRWAALRLIQDAMVPITTFTSGNCHWNRDTVRSVTNAGFEVTYKRDLGGIVIPMVLLEARWV